MKFLLVNLLLLGSLYCHSQRFSAIELISLYRDSFADFDTKVQKKKFEYIAIEPRANEEQIAKYALNETEDDSYYTEVFKKIKFKSGINLLDYQTDNKNDYLKIKAQLANLGFKSYNSKNQGGNTIFFYKSDNQKFKKMIVQVAIGTVDNSNGGKQTVYEFTIHNNLKMP